MKKPGAIEQIAGHPATQVGATIGISLPAVAAMAPLAVAIPSLLSTGASMLMQQRIEAAIEEIESKLSGMQEQLEKLTEPQYKLVCEALATLQRTNDAEKIEYLKSAILSGVQARELTSEKAYIASRVIRDASAIEIDFLLRSAPRGRIRVSAVERDGSIPVHDPSDYTVDNGVVTSTIISGLTSLGLIVEDGTWEGGYVLTPIAYTLIAILKGPTA